VVFHAAPDFTSEFEPPFIRTSAAEFFFGVFENISMKLRIPGFRNTRAKVARRAAPVLRFLAAPRRPPLKVIDGGGITLPATSYVSQLRAYSTGTGNSNGNNDNSDGKRRAPLRRE
jgi:hypothetical protein